MNRMNPALSKIDDMANYMRPQVLTVRDRLGQPRHAIQIIIGPRQVGKTTLIHQVMASTDLPGEYHAADAIDRPGSEWIEHIWGLARRTAGGGDTDRPLLLVIDEIQKVPNWAEMIKRLWDEDTAAGIPIQVVLLGSSPLLLGKGLTESLTGRFELTRLMHWSFPEMAGAFGWDLDTYIYHGGYPGSAPLLSDADRWSAYIRDALVEPTLVRDIYDLRNIRKPVLIRRLYDLTVEYAGQILSYNKMLGQLDDAGNTTTLAEYIELLDKIGILAGLEQYHPTGMRRKRSSPKLIMYNTALITAGRPRSFEETRRDLVNWGRLVEAAVGSHLINSIAGTNHRLYYWRERDLEVDFVLAGPGSLQAIEVKAGRRTRTRSGLAAFRRRFPGARSMIIGGDGLPLAEFFKTPLADLAYLST